MTDPHLCPSVEPGPVPHVGGPIQSGSDTVLVEDLKAARGAVDYAQCMAGGPDFIAQGSGTVLINDKVAARTTSKTQHNGVILGKSPTVIIGGPTVTVLEIRERRGGLPATAKSNNKTSDGSEAANQGQASSKSESPADAVKKCSIAGLRVTCGHRRPAPPGMTLEVVANPSQQESVSHKLPCGITVSGTRSFGGHDSVSVAVDLIDSNISGNRYVRLEAENGSVAGSSTLWTPIAGDSIKLILPEHGSDSFFPGGQPKLVRIVGKGCDDRTVVAALKIFPSTRIGVGGSISTESSPNPSSAPDFNRKLDEDFRKSFKGGLGIVNITPKLTASMSLTASMGWSEAEDWCAMFEATLKFSLTVVAEVNVSISLVQIAGIYFGIPPSLMAMGRVWLGDIELIFGLSSEFGIKEINDTFGCRSDRNWEGRAIGTLLATGALTLRVKARLGNKYMMAVTVEAGGKGTISATGGLKVLPSGMYVEGSARAEPIKAWVKVVVEGWFYNDNYSGEWTQLTEPVPFWGPKPYLLWSFNS